MRWLLNNPELKRNLHLEITPTRVILLPLILAAAFLLIPGPFMDQSKEAFGRYLQTAGTIVFFGFTVLWGSKWAYESIVSEVNERTWEFQRMTVISPLTMTVGKLLGATAFPWFGGVLSLAAFGVGSYYRRSPETAETIAAFIIVALLCHAISLLFGLSQVRKRRTAVVSGGGGMISILIIMWFFIGQPLFIHSVNSNYSIRWFGYDIPAFRFFLYTALYFMVWGVLGAWRAMRLEMQERVGPALWTAFFLATTAWAGGFIWQINIPPADMNRHRILFNFFIVSGTRGGAGWILAFFTGVFLTYGALLATEIRFTDFKRMVYSLRNRDIRTFYETLPGWLVTFLVLAAAVVPAYGISGLREPVRFFPKTPAISPFFLLLLLLFLARDLLFFVFVHFNIRLKRPDISIIVYLSLVYGLLPVALKTTEGGAYLYIFLPCLQCGVIKGLTPILLQIGVMAFLVTGRVRALKTGENPPTAA